MNANEREYGVLQNVRRSDRCVIRRSTRGKLLPESKGAAVVVKKAVFKHISVDGEQEVVATDDSALNLRWRHAEAANLGVDFGNEELPCATDLLFLCLDRSAFDNVA